MKTDKIGENIKKYRNMRNMSQSDLANKLLLSKRQVGEIETGNSLTSIETLADIAAILDIPIDSLFIGCNKQFLIYAIDDYLSLIDKSTIQDVLDDLNKFIEEES